MSREFITEICNKFICESFEKHEDVFCFHERKRKVIIMGIVTFDICLYSHYYGGLLLG